MKNVVVAKSFDESYELNVIPGDRFVTYPVDGPVKVVDELVNGKLSCGKELFEPDDVRIVQQEYRTRMIAEGSVAHILSPGEKVVLENNEAGYRVMIGDICPSVAILESL